MFPEYNSDCCHQSSEYLKGNTFFEINADDQPLSTKFYLGTVVFHCNLNITIYIFILQQGLRSCIDWYKKLPSVVGGIVYSSDDEALYQSNEIIHFRAKEDIP